MVSSEGQGVKWTDRYCTSFEDSSMCDGMSRDMLLFLAMGMLDHHTFTVNTSAGQQTASPLFLQHARHNDQGRATTHQLHCGSK